MWVDIGGCRTGSEGDDGGYMYHLHLGVIRVCAIRSVACAGRRRRRRWRLTHLAAAVVDILARTDQQGPHTHTYTRHAVARYRRRESGPREIPRSGRRRQGGKCRGKRKPSGGSPRSCGGPASTASQPRRRGCVIVRLDYGGETRRWLSAHLARYTASGERSQKRR